MNNRLPLASAQDYSASYVWYVVFLLSIVNVFNYMDRMALAVLAPLIKADLNLSDAQLGLLVGLAFAIFFAVCGLPIARWADYGVRRNIIALALVAWSAMTAISGAAQNIWHLSLARMGVGVGEAGGVPPSHSLLCDYVPPKQRAGAFAINQFGIYLGVMVGMAVAGWLGELIGWRWTFVALGLPGIVLAIVVRLTLREPSRGRLDAIPDTPGRASFVGTIAVLCRCRTFRMILLFLVASGFQQYGLTQWWPSFYARVHGLALSTVGVQLGIAIGLGSGIGLLAGGVLASRWAHRDVRLPLILGAATTALVLPAAVGSLFVSSPLTSILLVSLSAMLWSLPSGPCSAALYGVVPPRMRATAGALCIFSVAVVGLSLGPFFVGLVSDLLAPSLGPEALRYALLVPLAVLPLIVIALYCAAQRLRGDLAMASANPESLGFTIQEPRFSALDPEAGGRLP